MPFEMLYSKKLWTVTTNFLLQKQRYYQTGIIFVFQKIPKYAVYARKDGYKKLADRIMMARKKAQSVWQR